MNYENYMTMTATLKRKGALNPDTGMRTGETTKTINCFIYGTNKLIRDAKGEQTASTQSVITTEEILVGDFINGHEVKVVQPYNEFNGDEAIWEAIL